MSPDDQHGVRPVIWMRSPGSRRGPKPAFSLDDISRAAITIADRDGLGDVTLRAVATQLGTGAASLYRYIDNKADLHDLMVDAVTAEYALPATPSGDWRADVRALADRAREVHRTHPWALSLATDTSWGPNVQAFMEYFLAALSPTGLPLREQTELIAQFNSSVAGFASHEHRASAQPHDATAALARLAHLQQIAENPERPHLAAVVGGMLTSAQPDMDELFQNTVTRFIDSIDAARARYEA